MTSDQPESLLQINAMLVLQDQFNRRLYPDRERRPLHSYRAIWLECAEMLERVGWKWWKAPPAEDLEQQRIEIVDLWHFALSTALQASYEDGKVGAGTVLAAFEVGYEDTAMAAPADLIEGVARTALLAPHMSGYPLDLFSGLGRLCRHYQLPLPELFTRYVGKNALNHFRQEHGYRDGSYRKQWADGREDNEHLADVLAQLRRCQTPPDQYYSLSLFALDRGYAMS